MNWTTVDSDSALETLTLGLNALQIFTEEGTEVSKSQMGLFVTDLVKIPVMIASVYTNSGFAKSTLQLLLGRLCSRRYLLLIGNGNTSILGKKFVEELGLLTFGEAV